MPHSLKEKTGLALFWNFTDKGGQQVIQLIFMYVLARLLNPGEFGLVALLAIFTAVANLLQESGFSSALIRKKDINQSDYSSVFYFNVSISIVLYLLLYFSAPLIADFYDVPLLKDLSRLIFLSFVFNSLGIIQNVILLRKMDFRTNAQITFIAGIISGSISIWMAYSGYGVWSLAVQQVLLAFFRSTLLWFMVKWYPTTRFAFERMKSMAGYSVNLLITSVFNQVAANIYSIVIGKYFSISAVGYYGQANKLIYTFQSVVATSLQGVAYPLLTNIDEKVRIKYVFRKIMRISSFISFPIVMLIVISAEPIVIIALSAKWLPSVPILQILAIGASVYPHYCIISSLLQSLGRSKLILKMEVARNILSILSIVISIKFGVLAMVLGLSISSVCAFIFGHYFAGKHISYKSKELFGDIMPYLAISLFVFVPLYFLNIIIENNFILFFTQSIIGVGVYLLIIKLLGSKILEECWQFLQNKRFRK